MNPADLCATLGQGLPALFECKPAPHGAVRVRTPMMYPDGGVVDVFVLDRDGSYLLTDYEDTLGWLQMQTVDPRRTPKQRFLIEDACETLGVELYRGQLVMRSIPPDELPATVTRLAQAAVRVSDIWFTFRTRAFESVTEEVSEWLTDRKIRFDRTVLHRGRSGRDWTVDFETYAGESTSLVFLLSTGSRSAAQRVTDHVFTGCHDLSHLVSNASQAKFVSLFDDTLDVWREEDFKMLGDLSDVAFWSRPNELEYILTVA